MDMRRELRRDVGTIVADLSRTLDPAAQAALRQELALDPDKLEQALLGALRNNPFLDLNGSEIAELEARQRLRGAERDLTLLRQYAAKTGGRRVAVFAMPKSGSTFIQNAISHTARLPALTLTGVAGDSGRSSSFFGMNGREQELDELAVMLSTFRGQGNWVAQHHTRFTPYLGFQLRFHRILPVVTVRNIFDAIVSMDDMLMATPATGNWGNDPPFALPRDYHELPRDDRLALLAEDFGIWLVKFLVSWKRAISSGLAEPLILSYERDILNPSVFARRIAAYLSLDDAERETLDQHLAAAPGEAARFNKGVFGRGAAVPEEAREMLAAHARRFRADLGNDGMHYLFGDGSEDVDASAARAGW